MHQELRRQNFNVDADQAADLEAARISLHAPTIKDAVLRAARLVNTLAHELREGKRLVAIDDYGHSIRILIPEFETPQGWRYLCERPHPWRRQLYLKGSKLMASILWNEAKANGMSAEEIADDRDLPLEAVREAIRYSEQNIDLIRMEAEEERRRLIASGVSLGA